MTNSNKLWPYLLAALRCTRNLGSIRSLAAVITGIYFGLLAAGCTHPQVAVVQNQGLLPNPAAHQVGAAPVETQPAVAPHPKQANFEGEHKSKKARHVADWVVDSGDNRGMPFAIVDKIDAKVFVFDADGQLRGAAPALLGLARGDDSAPGIGDLKLSQIPPAERTTPAGRFVAFMAYNSHGKTILWVDYDGAVSLHRVITTNPREHRLQRLATPTPKDNRISFGCINVPAKFFDNVVSPAFTGTYGIVYVLPETRSNSETFASYYDVDLREQTGATANLNKRARLGPKQ